MDFLNNNVNVKTIATILLLTVYLGQTVAVWDGSYSVAYEGGPEFVSLEHSRARRDTPVSLPAADKISPQNSTVETHTEIAQSAVNPMKDAASPAKETVPEDNKTIKVSNTTAAPTVSVTQTPLLGENGSGIYLGNATDLKPKVSDPILPDSNITTDTFQREYEMIGAEHNLTDLTYDHHVFYNSSFIGNLSFFQDHWANITKGKSDVHGVLSNSHRRATTLKLSFNFPFYGHLLENITVATGGFIYTGEHVHNWLAATQYIAPLMANFDTTLSNDSFVKLFDDGEKFTALWENVNLREDHTKNFTFAVTLYKNGDIAFAYKDIPMPVQMINDNEHPVKVGISDAYLTDRMLFYIRRKTIYEYHRVSFKSHNITSNTVLRMTALPTCLQYNTCASCADHDTGFNCSWCEQIQKCSSGTDRNKQDWVLRYCDKSPILNASACPVRLNATDSDPTAYVTDAEGKQKVDAVVNVAPEHDLSSGGGMTPVKAPSVNEAPVEARSPIGVVVTAFVTVTLIASLAAWVLYAFKNPHTRSGQLLIKYRPSQWSWRRGEARYTAATIHM